MDSDFIGCQDIQFMGSSYRCPLSPSVGVLFLRVSHRRTPGEVVVVVAESSGEAQLDPFRCYLHRQSLMRLIGGTGAHGYSLAIVGVYCALSVEPCRPQSFASTNAG